METGKSHYFLSLQIFTVTTFLSGLCLQEDSKLGRPMNLTNFHVMHQEPIVVYQKIKEMRTSTIMQKSQELARLKDPEEDTQDTDTMNETLQDKCTTPTSSGESKLLYVCITSHICKHKSSYDSLQFTV